MASILAHSRYGKDKVRVFRIVRSADGKHHEVVEYYVKALLEGDVATSYTQADNTCVVATDSVKNIVYFLSKTSPYVLQPEAFALHLGTFFVSKYAHIHSAHITVTKLKWSRIPVGPDSTPHPHAFTRNGEEKLVVQADVFEGPKGKETLIGNVASGVKDLLVLKSTGSAFENFYRDEFTTLKEVDDRILSTAIDLEYVFDPVEISAPTDEKKIEFKVGASGKGDVWDAEKVAERALNVTFDLFATDESASVQATLFKMASLIVEQNAGVQSAKYTLPNKHYIPVDMSYLGIDNTTPAKAEVFMPIESPSGLISATVARA